MNIGQHAQTLLSRPMPKPNNQFPAYNALLKSVDTITAMAKDGGTYYAIARKINSNHVTLRRYAEDLVGSSIADLIHQNGLKKGNRKA
jgi:hypothetical protein